MRVFLSLLALALVASALPVSAQQPTFTETFQVRVGYGDIPTTEFAEAANSWNIQQRLELPAEGGGTYVFDFPPQGTLANVSCTCGAVSTTPSPGGISIDVPTLTSEATLTVNSQNQGDRETFSFQLTPPTAEPSQVLIVYAAPGTDVELPGDSEEVGLTTTGNSVIHYTSGSASDPLPDTLWASIHPGTGASAEQQVGDGSPGLNWLLVGVAFILGMVLWAFLVARGAVQTRTRKQVVATSAHVEAARVGKPVLEARRRALMAGLKEIEMAKMNKELDDASYDVVKAEFKAETVTTMRAIEEAGDDKK